MVDKREHQEGNDGPEQKKVKINGPVGITEPDVGIVEYIAPELTGFKGIIKQRYTDFLVNEIGLDGKVVHLVDLGPRDGTPVEEKKEKAKEGEKKAIPEPSEEQKQKLLDLLGQEDYEGIVALFTSGRKYETKSKFEAKEERTAVHQLLRESFDSRLESRTTPENAFQITLCNDRGGRGGRKRGLPKLDKNVTGELQDWAHFTVYKENKDTMEVANLLAKFLKVPPKSVAYGGTKDRRGVTVQRACISKMKIERLLGMNRTLRGIKLGSFRYESEPLRLGDLKGNEFLITIREIESLDGSEVEPVLNKALESLKTNGFINYYGMQRFGTFSISTHTVGKYVLNSQWQKVVELILANQELVIPESVEARKVWEETKDAKKALALMPRKCVAETSILRVLAKDPKAFLPAVMQIPRNLRIMYAHAYQSYVWNRAASERVKRYGLKVIPGDLVIDDEQSTPAEKQETPGFEEDVKEDTFVRARVVTEEDLKTKTIFDIVLPTPGFDIKYPENEVSKVYHEIMAADGLDINNMKRNIREFSLSGAYRNVVVRPGNVEWWIKRYESPMDQLVRTDLDLINEGLDESHRVVEDKEGSKRALVLRLQLQSSTYATMALREVMKVDTSRRGEGLDVKHETTKQNQQLQEQQPTQPTQESNQEANQER
ncbi:multisubstrate pseudouridine synthase 7 [Trichomonascus vanleenenianus]|uniref:pseudouridine synthase PUS7 n=1 Tax=Trichomonascus vanleenenianus TaxID=2268995 RepID=UPI003ECAB0BD